MMPNLFMKLCDEPELHFQTGPTFLSSNITQQVVVLHPWCAEQVSLVLPGLLVLMHRKDNKSVHLYSKPICRTVMFKQEHSFIVRGNVFNIRFFRENVTKH